MKPTDYLKLFIALAASALAGLIGSLFTAPSIQTWYAGLAKPALTPPSWVFGPVWTVLYLMMAVAAFLVWKKGLRHRGVKIALGVFLTQLVLNTIWSVIFFGLRNPGMAFAEIILLWVAVVATIVLFAKISKSAVWLLAPYLLWVSFAGYLNYSIWRFSAAVPGVACTNEAKLCPDGSSAHRTGPNCEFATCPGGVSLNFFSDSSGNSFQYPDGFGKKYIDPVDWPPLLNVINKPFACAETGSETARAGRTELQTVNDRDYCVTKISEGAAGSVYTQYAYAFPESNRTAILTFSVRFSQCGNFDEPEKGDCEAERAAFDVNPIIGQIVESIRLSPSAK